MLEAEAMFAETNTFNSENNLVNQNPPQAFVDASEEVVVGETYRMHQTHKDSVHVERLDSPSMCPLQDAAEEYDSMCSREQSSSSYISIKEDKKICYPFEVIRKYKGVLFSLEDGIETKNISLSESLSQQELQQEVYVVPTLSRSVQSDSKSCTKRENGVLQKLLRRCRYFDSTNGSSYVEGNCFKSQSPPHKLGKPCYVCGQFQHNGKKCPKRRICCACKRRGHIAKDCPMNDKEYDICLRCGESGHELSTCNVEYSIDDLQKINCYVCNETGHMCCGNVTYESQETVSCYNCGESGHPGLQCPKPLLDKCGSQPPSICCKCGEGGHGARNCTKDEGISGHHALQPASELGAEGDENRKKLKRRKTYRYSRRKRKMRGLTKVHDSVIIV